MPWTAACCSLGGGAKPGLQGAATPRADEAHLLRRSSARTPGWPPGTWQSAGGAHQGRLQASALECLACRRLREVVCVQRRRSTP